MTYRPYKGDTSSYQLSKRKVKVNMHLIRYDTTVHSSQEPYTGTDADKKTSLPPYRYRQCGCCILAGISRITYAQAVRQRATIVFVCPACQAPPVPDISIGEPVAESTRNDNDVSPTEQSMWYVNPFVVQCDIMLKIIWCRPICY